MFCDSTRVSNELGAGNLDRAKNAVAVTIKLSILLAVIVVLALGFGHDIWAGFFSDEPEIIKEFASLTPFLLISMTFDSVQGALQGLYISLFVLQCKVLYICKQVGKIMHGICKD